MADLSRPALSDLDGRSFDVIVTGGGVYGACFAYELASRGMQVLLVEKSDFGAAASANSLRIVHGGLRYLQKFDFLRARSSAMERSVLLRIFPGLITPLLCALPTGPGLKTGRLAFSGGLALNALITLDRNMGLSEGQRLPAGGLASRRWLSRQCPVLDVSENSGAAFWYDAFMEDPDRLVISYVGAAVSHGAVAINHASVEEYLSCDGQLAGVAIADQLTTQSIEVRAKLAIDCRSGWLAGGTDFAQEFRERRKIHYARGVNLIIDRELCGCAIGFRSEIHGESRRFLFMVPYERKTMVGTWYLPLQADYEDVSTSEDERAAMLRQVSVAMPGAGLSLDDVVAQHVGILPCMDDDDAKTGESQPIEAASVAPGQELGQPNGTWFVQGEKWTTARKTAQSLGQMIVNASGRTLNDSCSASTPLSAGHNNPPELWQPHDHIESDMLQRLWRRRGAQIEEILGPSGGADLDSTTALLRAEAKFAVEREMAMNLSDIIRRLGLGQLGCPQLTVLSTIAESVRGSLGWSESEMISQINVVMSDPRYLGDKTSAMPPVTDV